MQPHFVLLHLTINQILIILTQLQIDVSMNQLGLKALQNNNNNNKYFIGDGE